MNSQNKTLNYKYYRKQGDKYIEDALKKIQAEVAWIYNSKVEVKEAPVEDDVKKSTDAFVKIIDDNITELKRVAIRTRMANQHYRDLTIRCNVKSGGDTEINKIFNTDYYFYSWALPNNELEYVILDVHKLMDSKLIDTYSKQVKFNKNEYGEYDGSGFFAIPLWELNRCQCIMAFKLMDETLIDFTGMDEW